MIIDEAHNLMDAITGIHSISVTLSQLQRARAQLTVYLQKFKSRLKGKNRVYLAQTLRLIDSVVSCLQTTGTTVKGNGCAVQVSSMLGGKGVDQIDLFKLIRYIQESKLARKVDGYVVHLEEDKARHEEDATMKPAKSNPEERSVPLLTHIQGFLVALMNPSSEGRFFIMNDEGDIGLKYMLLDPTHQFKEIVEEARSVVLAGGTMSPVS